MRLALYLFSSDILRTEYGEDYNDDEYRKDDSHFTNMVHRINPYLFVVRGEVAEYLDELQTGGARAASTNALIGLDWYAGNDWTLSAQYSHKYVAWGEHRRSALPLCSAKNTGLSTLRISKDLMHNTLALQTFAYIDVTNGGVFNRLSADYALNDQLHAILGYDFFHADSGMFAVYKKNSEFWVKLKYSY